MSATTAPRKPAARNGQSTKSTAGRDQNTRDMAGQLEAINKVMAVIEFELDGTIRHANDKSISVQLTAGARVFLCDNGVMVGEIETVRRKHTTGLHLDALIREALTEYLDRLPDFGRMHDELTGSRLTDMRAKALIHDAFLVERVMATKYLPAVSGTYFRSPEHAERFPRKNRWRLYNAFTETFKQESVTLQADSFRALGRALCLTHN